MSKFYIVLEDGERGPFEEGELTRIEEEMSLFVESDVDVAIELVFVSGEEIRALNRDMRQTDRVTDVLSFPTLDGIKGNPLKGEDFPYDLDEEDRLFLGSVVICKERAAEQAEEYGHSEERELAYMTIHSILHLLGYDHIDEGEQKKQMRGREEYILQRAGYGGEVEK